MLYIVSTPIGNLEDLSLRQTKTLVSCEYILAEDTRSAGFLLEKITELFPQLSSSHKPKLISYYKEKEFEKLPEVMALLREDKDIALISEAGTPLISDPGSLLIKQVIKENISFTHIPGSTAVINAVVLAGFNTQHFLFMGFAPKKQSELKKMIAQIKKIKETLDTSIIFYESPFRVHDTLSILEDQLPDCPIAICREMTKKFEEVIRGTPTELMQREYKGELTVVIA